MTDLERAALVEQFSKAIAPELAALKAATLEASGKVVDERVDKIEALVKDMHLQRMLNGSDISGLDESTKLKFAADIRAITRNEKAALLEQNDQTGGYLVPKEVHAGIMRIAETVGLVLRDSTSWPMSTDELEVPRYTGSALQGEYIGEDEEADETGVDFGASRLIAKQWAVIFRVSNALLADASVALGDWLLAMAAEGMSYRIDREGFVGGSYAGSPFVGLLQSADVTVHTMGTGKTQFDDFDVAEASDAIGALPTAALNDAAFYFNRTVWAKIRARKDGTSGIFEFQQNGLGMSVRKENGLQPVGEILNYPVYTTDVLPANSTTAISTKFGVFGNLKMALYFGDRAPIEFARSEHATVGGKSTFRAMQTAIRVSHRHSVCIGLPAAAVALKTAAA